MSDSFSFLQFSNKNRKDRKNYKMEKDLTKFIKQILGHYCWGFTYDPLLNVSFQIGYPMLWVREPRKTSSKNPDIKWLYSFRQVEPRGKWEFYTRTAYWKITQDNILTTRSSSKKQIMSALATLSGQRLESCQVNAAGSTRMEFDLGGILEIRRCKINPTRNLWDLFFPDDCVLSILSDGTFEIENSKGKLLYLSSERRTVKKR